MIIADGFSCQEQIEQQTDRAALHMAQVLQMAIRGDEEIAGEPPEDADVRSEASKRIGMARTALDRRRHCGRLGPAACDGERKSVGEL